MQTNPTPDALVERLRETAIGCDHMTEFGLRDMCNEAADEIERLYKLARANNDYARLLEAARKEQQSALTAMQERIERLEKALEPFKLAADMADERMIGRYLNTNLPDDTTVLGALNLTLGHIREARAALGRGE